MAERDDILKRLAAALKFAQEGAWKDAHAIVQGLGNDPIACWLHGVLHKIEGDFGNARYWYARCDQEFEDFSDSAVELAAISRALADSQRRG